MKIVQNVQNTLVLIFVCLFGLLPFSVCRCGERQPLFYNTIILSGVFRAGLHSAFVGSFELGACETIDKQQYNGQYVDVLFLPEKRKVLSISIPQTQPKVSPTYTKVELISEYYSAMGGNLTGHDIPEDLTCDFGDPLKNYNRKVIRISGEIVFRIDSCCEMCSCKMAPHWNMVTCDSFKVLDEYQEVELTGVVQFRDLKCFVGGFLLKDCDVKWIGRRVVVRGEAVLCVGATGCHEPDQLYIKNIKSIVFAPGEQSVTPKSQGSRNGFVRLSVLASSVAEKEVKAENKPTIKIRGFMDGSRVGIVPIKDSEWTENGRQYTALAEQMKPYRGKFVEVAGTLIEERRSYLKTCIDSIQSVKSLEYAG